MYCCEGGRRSERDSEKSGDAEISIGAMAGECSSVAYGMLARSLRSCVAFDTTSFRIYSCGFGHRNRTCMLVFFMPYGCMPVGFGWQVVVACIALL